MSGGERTYDRHGADAPRVTFFARHVLGEVSQRPGQSKTARRDAFALWLAKTVASLAPFDQDAVLESLDRARLTTDDLILHCVPFAAGLLGQRWMCNELGFAQVTVGSARLFGLCHLRNPDWPASTAPEEGLSILLATLDVEDHMIGTAVLAYRLRRIGHSVRIKTRASAEDLLELLDVGSFDGLLLSCAQIRSLENIGEAVKQLRSRGCIQVPIVLGGAVLHEADGIKEKTGVTLATNDINAALSLIGRSAEHALPRVAE
ncbi:hypothetical protein [Maliponia aquimaris]|uniref:B12-binding domain-containing protein n=1 Tax=Maliponia aquimaris TaxID=1673631 RepID=A0A238JM91_9RHOB|nr:hypothetical protein [Maliponia aquimaris]SMX31790.1 hypothetical protein MAA8898_00040 [Maliponia aquimaris]